MAVSRRVMGPALALAAVGFLALARPASGQG